MRRRSECGIIVDVVFSFALVMVSGLRYECLDLILYDTYPFYARIFAFLSRIFFLLVCSFQLMIVSTTRCMGGDFLLVHWKGSLQRRSHVPAVCHVLETWTIDLGLLIPSRSDCFIDIIPTSTVLPAFGLSDSRWFSRRRPWHLAFGATSTTSADQAVISSIPRLSLM